MRNFTIAAALLAILSLGSCQKDELKTTAPQKSVDVSCESGNNWSINKKQFIVPDASKCYAQSFTTYTKFYWEDRQGNSIDLEVKATPQNNQVAILKAEHIQKLVVKIAGDEYKIDVQKFPIRHGMATISNQGGLYIVNVDELEVFDNSYYYIEFKMCQLEVKAK
jgi:hypothetical protein